MNTKTDAGAASGAPKDDGKTPDAGGAAAAGAGDDDVDDDISDDDQGGGDDVSLEELAEELGWKPKDKWKGAGEHVSAAEFLRRVGNSRAALKKTVRQQDEEFADRIRRLEQANTASRRREIADLKAYYDDLLDKAIDSGDKAKIRDARDKRDAALDDLEAKARAGDVRPPTDEEFIENFEPSHPTVMTPFIRDNAWILDEDDPEACEAFAEVEEIIQQEVDDFGKSRRHDFSKGPYAATRAEFEKAVEAAERHLRRAYRQRTAGSGHDEEDEDLDNDDRGDGRTRKGRFVKGQDGRDRGAERSGERRGGRIPVLATGNRRGGKSLATRLPPEAKAAAARFIKQGLYADEEEYAGVYFSEKGEKVD